MDLVTRITVFVASPGDVNPERAALDQVIDELNDLGIGGGRFVLQLKKWETHAWPGFGEDAQSVINAQIGDYDIFVGILWNRLGTPTRRSASGTLEEFERAYESWKKHKRPALLFYFNRTPADFSDLKGLKQKELVLKFKKALQKLGALYWEYQGADEFARFARRHLIKEIEQIKLPDTAPTPPPADPAVDRIHELARKLGYWHVGATRQLLVQIEQLALESNSPAVKDAAIAAAKEFLATGLFDDNQQATERARSIRKLAFQVIRRCAPNDLSPYFKNGELESVDLFDFDFSGLHLPALSFRNSFLLEANFERSILDGASLENAWVRNANFAFASLQGVDLTGADWFNALNLTEAQLRAVKPGTLLRAPATVDAMHLYLSGRYALPFDSWREDIKQALTSAWSTYLSPGGLADLVSRLTS